MNESKPDAERLNSAPAEEDGLIWPEPIKRTLGKVVLDGQPESHLSISLRLGPELEKAQARIEELEAHLRAQSHLVNPDTIESLFTAGANQYMLDEGRDSKGECPYPADTLPRHWWTRGYAHQARALRAVELQAQLALETKRWLTAVDEGVRLKAQLAAVDAALDDASAPDSTEAHALDDSPIIERIKLWKFAQDGLVDMFEAQLADERQKADRDYETLRERFDLNIAELNEVRAQLAEAKRQWGYAAGLKDGYELRATTAESERDAAIERAENRDAELVMAIQEKFAAEAQLAEANAALDDKVEIAPDDLLATMLARAEKAEQEVKVLREQLSTLTIPQGKDSNDS